MARALGPCGVALLALEVGAGCALLRGEEPVPPGFERVALRSEVVVTDEGQLEGDLHGDSTVKGVAIGLGLGSVSGGAIGFGWGTIACVPTAAGGPLAVILYPVCVFAFTGVGVIAGGTSGMVAGGSTGLPWKTTNEVNAILDTFPSQRDFGHEFRGAVETAVPGETQVGEDGAEAVVTARLDDFDLRQHLRQRLSVRMRASMVQQWPANGGEGKTRTCAYEYTSPTMDVEDWLLHEGELFGQTFDSGVHTLAGWMARDLRAFALRSPEPQTEFAPATCFQLPD
jgi:hypothetical protein